MPFPKLSSPSSLQAARQHSLGMLNEEFQDHDEPKPPAPLHGFCSPCGLIPSQRNKYSPWNWHIPHQGNLKEEFPFPQVGYVSSSKKLQHTPCCRGLLESSWKIASLHPNKSQVPKGRWQALKALNDWGCNLVVLGSLVTQAYNWGYLVFTAGMINDIFNYHFYRFECNLNISV